MQLPAVELKVEMMGSHSERRIKKCLSKLRGVKNVEVELSKKKVVVRGEAEESRVIRILRRRGFRCAPWCNKTEFLLNAYVLRYQTCSTPSSMDGFSSCMQERREHCFVSSFG